MCATGECSTCQALREFDDAVPARSSRAKPRNQKDIEMVEAAILKLREARMLLAAAGADRSRDKVSRAVTSAEGALRHVQGIISRIGR